MRINILLLMTGITPSATHVLCSSQTWAAMNSLACAGTGLCCSVKSGRLNSPACLVQVPVSQHDKYWLDFGTNKYKPYALQGGATDLHMPFVAQVVQQLISLV